jgi:DNA repair exonuclease SbcCD ATPase subunit
MGKSSIFGAIAWVLFGKNLKGKSDVLTWEKYRTKDYQGVKVEIYFQKDGYTYQVIRCQKYKGILSDGSEGRDRLIFLKDGYPTELKGKFGIQNQINQTIGVNFDLFINSIMFGQGLKRLIQETNSDKKAIFEEIFNLNFINTAKDIAKGRKDTLRENILDMENDLNILSDRLDNLKRFKRLAKSENLKNKNQYLKDIKRQEVSRLEVVKKIHKLNQDLSDPNLKDLDSKFKSLTNDIIETERTLAKYNNLSNKPLEEVIDKIYNYIKCKDYNKSLKLLSKLKDAFIKVRLYTDKYNKLLEQRTVLKELKTREYHLKSLIQEANDELIRIDDNINSIKERYNKKPSLDNFKADIKNIRHKIKPLKLKYDKSLATYKDYQWLLDDPLSNKGIKAYLFDSCLGLLNDTLNSYVPILGFKIEFMIDLESARKDFVTNIYKEDKIIDYSELSGGEKQLVNVAMALAMNEVLTVSQGFNIAFLDEVFESLSSDNIELVVQLLDRVFADKTLFLITHQESLPLSKVKVLQAEKVNGLSNYKLL